MSVFARGEYAASDSDVVVCTYNVLHYLMYVSYIYYLLHVTQESVTQLTTSCQAPVTGSRFDFQDECLGPAGTLALGAPTPTVAR